METLDNIEETSDGNDDTVSGVIDELFLPPKIQSRETGNNSKTQKRKSHTILTSEEIVQQKRQQQIIKAEKEAKKAKKIIKKI